MARRLKGLKASYELHPQYKVPQRIYDIEAKTSQKDLRKAAEALLKKIAGDLQIEPNLSQLKFEKTRETILGTQVLFQQYHNDMPISGAWIRLDFDKSGSVYNIQNDLVPKKLLEQGKKRTRATARTLGIAAEAALPSGGISEEQARTAACDAARDEARPNVKAIESEQVYYILDGAPKPTWKVIVVSESERAGSWKIYIDAVTGVVLDKIDLLKRQDGRGQVFDPSPVVTLNDTTLEDDSHIPDQAYFQVTLRDLEPSGFLDGPFVSTRITKDRVKRADLTFTFTRSHRAFKEVMVYFHIDRIQRYIQELGINNAWNHQIEVNIDGIKDDNSFYDPAKKSLTFGRGGVDDAEDADIILHEYGHALQDDMMPGFGPDGETKAMGEGFGDYLAGTFFADVKPDRLKPCVGPWNSTAYSADDPPNLRRLDSNKKYPKDVVHEEHADGEIWSACLWLIRAAVGRRTADQLIIAHHFQLPGRNATFEQAAKSLITTDEQLNQGRHVAVIRDIFVRRGILPNPKRGNRRAGQHFHEILVHGK